MLSALSGEAVETLRSDPQSVARAGRVVLDELGAIFDDATAADAEGLAVTEVDEESEAYEKGLRAGDVITEAGQQKVRTIADLEDRVEAAREAGRKSLLLLVRRAGDPRFVALSLAE